MDIATCVKPYHCTCFFLNLFQLNYCTTTLYTSFPLTVGGNALLLVVLGIHDGFTGIFFVLFSFVGSLLSFFTNIVVCKIVVISCSHCDLHIVVFKFQTSPLFFYVVCKFKLYSISFVVSKFFEI